MMLLRFINKLLKEYKEYKPAEKLFIFFMMICLFVLTAEASITRSVSNSIFLYAYSVKTLTYAWIASLPLNYLIVFLYNRFIPQFGCRKMMFLILSFSVVFNIFCAVYIKSLYGLPFFLYLWKDVFVIFMFHKIWSVIHSTINMSRAKYIYGILFGVGGVGSVVGSLVPSFLSVLIGTDKLLLVAIPLYVIIYYGYKSALKVREGIKGSEDISMSIDNGSMKYGAKLIRKSKWLKFILLLVVSIQVSSTILDYQFTMYLKQSFPALDLRTQFMGRLFGIVSLVNVFLQFFGSFILLRIAGLRATHAMIPLVLLSNAVMFFFMPGFALICASFGTIKSLDYSIFGIVKEMLYIPLNVEEKFKAKAIIDVFAYRGSKAIASLLILGLSFIHGNNITLLLTVALMCIFSIWLYSVMSMKEYFAKIEETETV